MDTARTTFASWMALPVGTLAAAGCCVALTMAAHAHPAAPDAAPKHVTCTLIAEQIAATPGSTITLGIDLTIEKKWHVYSTSRNDNGFPPNAEWKLPAGFTVDALQWPAPVRHVDPGDLLNHVYFDHVTLPVTLHVPTSAQPGSTAVIKATVKWLVCDTTCVGEDADVEFKLTIAKPGETPAKSADAKKFDEARLRLPRELVAGSKDVTIEWPTPKSVTITVPGASHIEFFPDDACFPFVSPIKDPVADGAKLSIALDTPEPEQTALVGVLEVRRADKPTVWYRLTQTPPGSPTKPTASQPFTPPKTSP